jgi:hypothetical protein
VGWWSFGTERLAYIDAVIAAMAFLWCGYIAARFVEFVRSSQKPSPTRTDRRRD